MSRRRGGFRFGRGLRFALTFVVGALLIGAAGAQAPAPGPDVPVRPVVDGVVGFLVVAWGAVLLVGWAGARPKLRRKRARSRRR